MSTPRKEHWIVVKRLSTYFFGTKYYAMCYQVKPRGDSELNVHVFFDVNSVGDMNQWRSNNGYVFKMFGEEIS